MKNIQKRPGGMPSYGQRNVFKTIQIIIIQWKNRSKKPKKRLF